MTQEEFYDIIKNTPTHRRRKCVVTGELLPIGADGLTDQEREMRKKIEMCWQPIEIGDRVQLTPAYVAMGADEEDESQVSQYIDEARNAIGIVTNASFHNGHFSYSIHWISKVHPNKIAWFDDFEVCAIGSDFDWTHIPFDEYRDNPFSENHESHKRFREELRKDLEKALAEIIIEKKRKNNH